MGWNATNQIAQVSTNQATQLPASWSIGGSRVRWPYYAVLVVPTDDRGVQGEGRGWGGRTWESMEEPDGDGGGAHGGGGWRQAGWRRTRRRGESAVSGTRGKLAREPVGTAQNSRLRWVFFYCHNRTLRRSPWALHEFFFYKRPTAEFVSATVRPIYQNSAQ